MKKLITYFPRSVWLAVLIAIIIYVGGLFLVITSVGYEGLIWGDGIRYVELSNNLKQGLGFVYQVEGTVYSELFRTPGVPWLMSNFLRAGEVSYSYFFLITSISAFLIPLLLFYIARSLFSESVGIISVWLYVLEPLTTLYSWFPLTEGPFMILMCIALALAVHAVQQKNTLSALLSGIFVAFSLYMRPVVFMLYIAALVLLIVYFLYKKAPSWQYALIILITMFITLFPWMNHVKQESGVFTLTASGWRNVYTDYVASIYAVQNGTDFISEKRALIKNAESDLGLTTADLNSPESSAILKTRTIEVITGSLGTVMKLESLLLLNYFTNTSYQLHLGIAGILPKIDRTVSPSHVLLSQGLSGLPVVIAEMKKVYFLPILERVWSFSLFLLALLGVWLSRNKPITYVFVIVIALGALSSTAIGFGVEGRLRIPILPLYFMFVSVALLHVYERIKSKMT